MGDHYWLVKTYDGEYHGEMVLRAESVELLESDHDAALRIDGYIVVTGCNPTEVRRVTKDAAFRHSNWAEKLWLKGKV